MAKLDKPANLFTVAVDYLPIRSIFYQNNHGMRRGLIMFNSAGEIEKLEQYFAELFRRLGRGAAAATGEKFFRMWEEACQPLPFAVPSEGLKISETTLIPPEKDKDAHRVACLSWDAEGQCPSLLIETAEKSVIQRLGFKDGAIVFGESIEIDAAMPEESEGEKVEVMSAVAKIIKRDYPQIDLNTVKKEYIKKALKELQETQPSKTAKKLIRRTGLYKELMAKVLSEMEQDERDANLWARNALLPRKEFDVFKHEGKYTEQSICSFAAAQGIAPGIIVGRLQHDGLIGGGSLNRLKKDYDLTK